MTHNVLARQWRPQNFKEVIGQPTVVQTLVHALEKNRLHHAYLFTGTRGVGKTTIARILAKCLNCSQGVTPEPCGVCENCQAIQQGNCLDLLEVDGASRTKVEDTRALLDNIQYAPHTGKYKIYLIDEVHMLSNHSFNALLKTLEEPPQHVIFLLATTDPQKLPVTVLSRCLQFHLSHVSPNLIKDHLASILTKETIPFEITALESIAHAGKGSVRDSLSLLDQVIGYSNANITLAAVHTLLGTLPAEGWLPLLTAIANHDGVTLLKHIAQLAEQVSDFTAVLNDIIDFLHHLAIKKTINEYDPELSSPVKENLNQLINLFSAADIQLLYQIAIMGKKDFPLAATTRMGFEMTLLRMLAFYPKSADSSSTTPTAESTTVSQTDTTIQSHRINSSTTPPVKNIPKANNAVNWEKLVLGLSLSGISRNLAQHCALKTYSNDCYHLILHKKHQALLTEGAQNQLQQALNNHHQTVIKIKIELAEEISPTPAQIIEERNKAAKLNLAKTIEADPNVKHLMSTFNATLDFNSLNPLTKPNP